MKQAQILIVDDDPDIVDTLSMILQQYGHETAAAEDGAAALERLRGDFTASLILLDLMMPVMDGQTFLDELDRSPTLSEIPVVVFSGDHARVAAARGRTIVARMCKPIALGPLLEVVAEHGTNRR